MGFRLSRQPGNRGKSSLSTRVILHEQVLVGDQQAPLPWPGRLRGGENGMWREQPGLCRSRLPRTDLGKEQEPRADRRVERPGP